MLMTVKYYFTYFQVDFFGFFYFGFGPILVAENDTNSQETLQMGD